ncbi:WYL domain-containing protein [Rhodoferax antarcticus]|uniref:WYL domain-containing protein n=1 Tax=Rhodoferax antarcticus TaxID=81479 RepID=UPI003872FE3C
MTNLALPSHHTQCEASLVAVQKTEAEADGRVRLTATVNDTRQLQWWLLGQGDGVEVLGPDALRSDVLNSIKLAFKNHIIPSRKSG